MGGEQRKRGVSPSSEGLKLIEKAMNDRCWNAQGVANAVSSDGSLNHSLDEKTVLRFLGKDPKNPRVDKKTAQLICKVLDLTCEQVIDEPAKPGQLETDKPNPFSYGVPVTADRFHGRKLIISEIKGKIGAETPQCVNIIGFRNSGKSSILKYIQDRPYDFFIESQKPIVIYLDLQDKRFHSPFGIMRGIKKEISDSIIVKSWLNQIDEGDEFFDAGLCEVNRNGHRLIILLDKIERIKSENEEFQNWVSGWDVKISNGSLTLVLASQRPIEESASGIGIPSHIHDKFHGVHIGLLTSEEWQHFTDQNLGFLSPELVHYVDSTSGGWAFYTQMALSIYRDSQDFDSAIREFRFQAEKSFSRLWDDLKDEEKLIVKSVIFREEFPMNTTAERMIRLGLLKSDRSIFSDLFSEFVRERTSSNK